MKTTYEYKVAFTLLGGFCLPQGNVPIELFSSNHLTVQLLKNADQFCFENDLGAAIGMVYLNKSYLNPSENLSKESFYQEIENIKKSRHEKIKNTNILAIKVSKTCNIEIKDVVYTDESIIVTVSENDNDQLINNNAKEIDNVICAIRTNSLNIIEIEKISEGIYFPKIDGKILFRKKVSPVTGKIFCATAITPTEISHITESYKYLSKHKDLEKIQRLYVQMHDKKNDEFKSFIFGWTALEIFLNQNFETYNRIFYKNLTKGNKVYEKILEHLNPAIKDRVRLNDKFLIIASCLNQKNDILNDFEKFDKIKSFRDHFFHGKSIKELPNNDLDSLLSKYLKLHIKYKTNKKHTT